LIQLRRRDALLGVAADCLAGSAAPRAASAAPYPGGMIGAHATLGHRLRSGGLPEPSSTERAQVVIVGGGIAGLSAAWRLRRTGVDDVVVVELEPDAGGNARSGRNSVSAYPWGAHYVPLLTEESVHAAALFEELGIITGRDAAGRPIYDDFALCADPRERLYIDGAWQDDLLPDSGISRDDRRQYAEFFAAMDTWRRARGSDGRKAFAIPLDRSSADERFRALDRISMADYMRGQSWTSRPLLWYVDYCCRDDYGTTFDHVSAWAGVHYHASRDGVAGADDPTPTVLTWPEGNGYIVHRLQAMLAPVRCDSLAWRVLPTAEGVTVDVYQPTQDRSRRIDARAVILCTPRFVADRLLGRMPDASHSYAPWMVANVTLDRLPSGRGADLCWDNVIYNSRSLGYVVATHQSLAQVQTRTVLTYYWPLCDALPAQARAAALNRSLGDWQAMVADELLRVHPELDGAIERIDVCVWGHAMIRPTPGYIWGSARAAACEQAPPIFFAHSDMSGISIFEEANERGVAAADAVQAWLRR
jgi:NAD(P)-binding Rossmann-like domain